jgi:hypothetical protein
MVTDYSQILVATQPRTRASFGQSVRRALRRIGQAFCGLRGHENVLHYERDRFALECSSCGHVSPGWDVKGPQPQLRYAGDPGRHQLRPRPRRVA